MTFTYDDDNFVVGIDEDAGATSCVIQFVETVDPFLIGEMAHVIAKGGKGGIHPKTIPPKPPHTSRPRRIAAPPLQRRASRRKPRA